MQSPGRHTLIPIVVWGIVVSLMIGCGGGGGGGIEPERLSLVSTEPADGATGVSRDTVVKAFLNRNVDPGSVTVNSFYLEDVSLLNKISANVSVNGAIVELRPVEPLEPGRTYRVTLASTITDTAGQSIAAIAYWKLTIAPVTSEDTSAPNAPVNVTGTYDDPGKFVLIEWLANSDPDIDSYNIYRAKMGNPQYLIVNQSHVTANSFQDINTVKGTVYGYYVTAMDQSGNESPASDVIVIVAAVISKITVSPSVVTIDSTTDAIQLSASVEDASGGPIDGVPIIWTSSNSDVVTVDKVGVIRPSKLKTGSATVTASHGIAQGIALIEVRIP